jgi:hypothetical protein
MIQRRNEKGSAAGAGATKQRLVIIEDAPVASAKKGGCC